MTWILIQWRFASEADAVERFLSESPLLAWRDHLLLAVVGGFAAYVTGVAAILDPCRGLTGLIVAKMDERRASAKAFGARSIGLIEQARELLKQTQDRASKRKQFDEQSAAAMYNQYATLRARLMTRSEDLYLTCDKLDAEAALRMSSALPILAASSLAWVWLDESLFVVGVGVALVLFLRGIGRAFEARDVARGAVVAGVAPHPLKELIDEFPFNVPGQKSDGDREEEVGVS